VQKELVAAKMFGRWKNGSPLVRYPDGPGASQDNDFLYAAQDPFGMSCPLGAHIRRANPRDSLLPGVIDPLTISNSHRLLRVGRPYQPQGKLVKPGIGCCAPTSMDCATSPIQLQAGARMRRGTTQFLPPKVPFS
jgi:deferrochelatase/peroxidase EfeB